MRKGLVVLASVGLLAAGAMAGCDGSGSGNAAGGPSAGKVGVILPDTTSTRWATIDFRYLKGAFDAAGVQVDIQNAQGDKAAFQSIAEGMISSGVKVLMIVSLDPESGKTVLDRAKAAGIATIDYDRLTLGGGADYYVSFDSVKVGEMQAQGLVDCLTARKYAKPVVAELNNSPADPHATLFRQGYDSVLKAKYDAGTLVKGPSRDVPGGDGAQARRIVEQVLTSKGNVQGVLAANDGLADAVIGVLKKTRLAGRVAVTGRDATAQGLRNILTGDQCMTVHKAVKPEAVSAAELAVALAKGRQPSLATSTVKDPRSNKDVAAVLVAPEAITKETVKDVIAQGFVAKEEVCTADVAALCTAAGIS